MPKRILRHFFYLDESIVDDYLSQLEGGLQEGPYTSKETSSGNKEGKIGGNFHVEASIGGSKSSSSEITQSIRETPAAKFTRLYDMLMKEELIQVLNGFDQPVYDTIEIGEIVEVRGTAELTRWEKISKAITGTSGLLDLMTALGQNPFEDEQAREAYQGITDVVNKKDQSNTILVISPIGSPKFKFVATLESSYTRRKKEELEGEISILGKVNKRLAKGEKIDIFSLVPDLDALQNLNRTQRRQAHKNQTSTESPLDEKIGYPAIQIQPVAIYQ